MRTIFDIGMYDASDTQYYLESGYKVVAVEANPAFANRAKSSLEKYLLSGQLEILNAAVSPREGSVELTVCGDDLGSSSIFQQKVVGRSPIGTYTVPAISTQRLFQTYGVPYFLKQSL